MIGRSRRRARSGPRARSRGRRWRPRSRLSGCLLFIAGLIVILIILSLLFGGFQIGTKAGGGMLLPFAAGAVMTGGSP